MTNQSSTCLQNARGATPSMAVLDDSAILGITVSGCGQREEQVRVRPWWMFTVTQPRSADDQFISVTRAEKRGTRVLAPDKSINCRGRPYNFTHFRPATCLCVMYL